MRPTHAVRLTLVVLGLAASPGARAQDGTSLGVDLAPVGDRAYGVHSAGVAGDGIWRAGAVTSYAREPFVLVLPDQNRDRVVVDQAWVVAQGSYALWHRLLLGLEVPLTVLEGGDPAPATGAVAPRAAGAPKLGDLALVSRYKLLGPADDGVKLSLALKVWAPTGATESYAGGDGFRGRLFGVVGGTSSDFTWSMESGLLVRESRQFAAVVPMRLGTSVTFGAAAAYALDPKRSVTVGPELSARSAVAGGARLLDARSSGAELWLALRFRPAGGAFSLGAAAGPGIGQAIGIPDYRVLLSLAWAPEETPPPPDRDDDRVADAVDACPDLPGSASVDPVMNGCPDLPTDRDGDAIPDTLDACPLEPGEPTADRRTHGCPRFADTDGDGENDRIDACPKERGVRSRDAELNGCPPPPPPRAELVEERIVISEQVHFETGTAVIRPDSDGILGAVARVLSEHPEVELVEVRGHTDSTGPPELNRRLSRERAAAVVRWLVGRGIAESRLQARGFGPDRPISDNGTDVGRARNRRVEFVVVGSEGRAP